MRKQSEPHKVVTKLVKDLGTTFRQVSEDTGLPYKPLLREAKTGESRMSLDTAAVLADYFGINIADLTSEKAAA